MKIRTKLSYLAITGLLALSIAGCRSSRESVGHSATGTPSQTVGQTQSPTPAERISKVVGSYRDAAGWTDISVPVSFKIRSPKSLSVSGRMVMVRDRCISVSMRMLGFEVAGFYADPDSIIVYEKLNKSMVVEPMSRLTSMTGLTLSDLQDLLMGRICCPGANLDAINVGRLFDISADNGSIVLTPRSGLQLSYLFTDTALPQLSLAALSTSKVRMTCTYGQAADNTHFSPSLTIDASAGKTRLDADLKYSLQSLKADTGAKASIPSAKGYRRISLEKLIKALGVR